MEYLNRPPDPTADLIFLDLNMPGLTGFQCLAQIREDTNLKNNIIIIFTTSSNTDDIEKLYAMGANYFITKPTDYSDMEKLINTALALIQVSGTAQPAFQDFYIRA
ncbi:response regulator [Flavobacterium sp. Sd200]|uniref:response regulator n=1 Tax=Flavobacterium sp. Sd200 TaxID=2692211 RepID=UPI001F01CD6A|nr:response regulator [Flavobacterium sp. Sd200]